MAFALILMGLVMIVAAVRNQQSQLVCLIQGDFSTQGNFLYWIVALLIIGAVGYVEKLKPVSDAFLVLIILVLFLASGNSAKLPGGGFFKQFTEAITGGTTGGTVGGTVNRLLGGIQPL
jgi:hypothetical protein